MLLATAAARVEKDKRVHGLAESITFAIETGMRLEEQFSMRWSDVDMARKRVTVIGKGGKKREVPLSEKATQTVSQIPRHLRVAEGQDWVWVKADGELKAFKTAAKAAGLKDVKWHDLRRTCGCRCLQDRGWSHAQVQLLLGHESVTATERHYAFRVRQAACQIKIKLTSCCIYVALSPGERRSRSAAASDSVSS